jgi:hypothetical protein
LDDVASQAPVKRTTTVPTNGTLKTSLIEYSSGASTAYRPGLLLEAALEPGTAACSEVGKRLRNDRRSGNDSPAVRRAGVRDVRRAREIREESQTMDAPVTFERRKIGHRRSRTNVCESSTTSRASSTKTGVRLSSWCAQNSQSLARTWGEKAGERVNGPAPG